MNILQSIRSFIRTADAGSLAAAARTLGISPAAVGQNIARLEAHLGVRLFNRTTRTLALTERGALYLAEVRHIERDLQRAQAAVTDPEATPQGRLRVASTAAFGRHVLAPLLPALQARHPRLEIELLLTDRAVDHAREDVDVSLRIEQQLVDGIVARPIAQVPFVVCAAPSYLAQAGTPSTPDALRDHRCLVFRYPVDGRLLPWGFVRDGIRFDAGMRPALVCDDIDALAAMAAAGGGIARLAAFVAAPWLSRGELQVLFATGDGARTSPEPMRLFLCVSDRRDLTPKVRALMQALLDALPEAWRVDTV
ncbi:MULTISPECIES: LysR family transcriptional regulator [Stenotrophomonas]|uniref:LysR family transcriptional regulator n=3 Tax=Stenotrophomonas TaxID=40323 RepID=A0A4S2CWW0_STEMA|nr:MULTISPECIES: LysR family transcriptional regulator [Stenotrophomonas]MBD3825438.1 LysR family transcriptional regulator [Stenotrophomonas sp.]TGY32194.1 LysR family transcriptional regulator [Stenotrophomonas maltophilia]